MSPRQPGRPRKRVDPEPPGGPDADPDNVAREIVLRQLTMRSRSRAELAQTLARKNVTPEVAERVLNRMEQVGLIDDDSFAADWVASRQQRKRLSRRGLQAELTRKGIDRDVISAAVADVDDDAEYRAALALVHSKERTYQRLEPAVRRRRLAGLLARRGFSTSVSTRVLREALTEDADPDPDGG